MHFSVLFFYCLLLVVCLNHPSDARDTITRSNPIRDDGHETLISAGEIFELGFFTPDGSSSNNGNKYVGIWYKKLNPKTIVWVANRDNPVSDSSGSFGISEDGNLKVLSNGDAYSVTRFQNAGTYNRTVKLLDSGNLIVFDSTSRKYLWQSFEHPTDTFLPGMKMDDNMVLTSWSTATDPATGNFTFGKDHGFYRILNRSSLHWTSDGPNIPNYPSKMRKDIHYLLSGFAEEHDGGTYQSFSTPSSGGLISFNFTNPNITRASYYNLTKLFMDSTGELQCHRWDDGNKWILLWSEPRNRCSVSDACGKFSICNSTRDTPCSCLPGFKPVIQEDWNNGIYTQGCERDPPIPCDKLKQLKFSKWLLSGFKGSFQPFDKAKTREDCEEECQKNCNCLAYYSLNRNLTDREASEAGRQAGTMCWTATEDLENLQQDDEANVRLYIRSSDTDIGYGHAEPEARECKPCGKKRIPYPLSTELHCGDPLYNSFYCDNSTGKFQFRTLSSEYPVIGFFKENRTFVIEVNKETASSCDARNLSRQIVKLNPSFPFNVTNWCFTGLDNSFDEPSSLRKIEISWKLPLEPSCSVSTDCQDWANTSCEKGNGARRCYCDQDYQWNGTSLSCVQGPPGKSSRRQKDAIIASAVIAIFLLVACFSYNFYWRQRMSRRTEGGESSMEDPVLWSHERSDLQVSDVMDEDSKSGTGVPFYSWESMLAATDNFSDAHKLGRGGFGLVYKGTFPGGREMAVKRLSTSSVQGINEFRNEVMLIAKLQHRNLVRLLGYCIKENEKILLYEYMSNKSLDAFIFDEELGMLLNWNKRFDIILGIARGVLYLHQDSRLRIIHRDLKTSNILLDEEMNPKISDFGLARIVEGKGTEASTKKVVGTYGYMSPEYASHGLFSIKSDVYSFGVVVLEIISGKKNTGLFQFLDSLNLLGYVWRLWTEKRTLDLVDPILKLESCEKSEVIKCINVGLLCVQEDPDDRPTMSNVVFMLGGEATSVPVPNQPAFLIRKRTVSTSSSSSAKLDSVFNELTMSAPEGR